jgi:predicted secreted protein
MRQHEIGARQRRFARNELVARLGRGAVALFLVGLGAASASASAATTKSVTLTDASNGHVIKVRPGTSIYVTLTSNDWTFSSTGLNKIATLTGTSTYKENKPIVVGGMPSACRPGACGYEVAHYVALRVGQMRLSANRTSCSTGVACSAVERHWTVVVRIR